MRLRQGFAAAALFAATAALALAGDVVVLKGGTVIELKQAWVRRGNTAYLTRSDGTLLSVPVSEIDRDATATAAANRAAPAPPPKIAAPSTPAEVARATREAPRARVRITDADVSHPMDLSAEGGFEEKKEQTAGGPRVEVADYSQEKSGAALVVRGQLRNPGQGTAENVRLTVSAIDEKGQSIDGAIASLSKGSIEPGLNVDFTTSLNVGDKIVASLRFAPTWTGPKPVAPAPQRPGAANGAAAASANKAPAPVPTPYGRGTLYANPVANAPSQPPPDGKTGYIPGASHPDNQPKPPIP